MGSFIQKLLVFVFAFLFFSNYMQAHATLIQLNVDSVRPFPANEQKEKLKQGIVRVRLVVSSHEPFDTAGLSMKAVKMKSSEVKGKLLFYSTSMWDYVEPIVHPKSLPEEEEGPKRETHTYKTNVTLDLHVINTSRSYTIDEVIELLESKSSPSVEFHFPANDFGLSYPTIKVDYIFEAVPPKSSPKGTQVTEYFRYKINNITIDSIAPAY